MWKVDPSIAGNWEANSRSQQGRFITRKHRGRNVSGPKVIGAGLAAIKVQSVFGRSYAKRFTGADGLPFFYALENRRPLGLASGAAPTHSWRLRGQGREPDFEPKRAIVAVKAIDGRMSWNKQIVIGNVEQDEGEEGSRVEKVQRYGLGGGEGEEVGGE